MKSLTNALLILVACYGLIAEDLAAQDNCEFQKNANLNLFNWPGVIGLGVKGKLSFCADEITFMPSSKSLLYPHNDRICKVSINVGNIARIRRNVFFLVPNRLIIKTRNAGTYRFIVFGKRKKLINLVMKKKRNIQETKK